MPLLPLLLAMGCDGPGDAPDLGAPDLSEARPPNPEDGGAVDADVPVDAGAPGDASAPTDGGAPVGNAACHAPRFCFENPLVSGNPLTAVSAVAADDLWAVGNYTILRGPPDRLAHASTAVPGRLTAVHARAAQDVWAVGDGGLVFHYDGKSVQRVTFPNKNNLSGVFAAGADEVYVTVGFDNPAAVWRYQGGAWTQAYKPAGTGWFNGIWGSSRSDIWVVGSSGLAAHYDGASWSASATGSTNTMFAVWGSGPSDVYGTSTPELSLRYQGAGWSTFDTGYSFTWATLKSVFGTSSTDVWALGAVGQASAPLILHSDGTRWTRVAAATGSLGGLGSGWAARPDLAFAPSMSGLDRWNGAAWTGLMAGPRVDGSCGSVAALSGGRAFVACDSGEVLSRQPDTTWRAEALPTGVKVTAVAAATPDFAVAVGPGGTILHFDGATWTRVASPTTAKLRAALVLPGRRALAVGDGGTLLRYNGSAWSAVAVPAGAGGPPSLYSVWGASGSEVWLAGDQLVGTPPRPRVAIYRYDGAAVTAAAVPVVSGQLFAVAGSAANDVWASGIGLLLHYDGAAWSTVAGAPAVNLYGIYARSASEVYFASTPVYRYDGTAFTALAARGPMLNDESVFSVGGSATGPVLFGGFRGVVLRLRP